VNAVGFLNHEKAENRRADCDAAFGGDDRGFFQSLGLLEREPHQLFGHAFAINIRQIKKRVARFLRGEQRLHAGFAGLGRHLAGFPTAGDAPAAVG